MAIIAMSLFGSRARGDQKASSDTDMLMVTDDRISRHVSRNNISSSFYSIEDLEKKSRDGDLFLYHVLHEGIIIYDPDSIFPKLREVFYLRKSYQREITQASDLGWFFVQNLERICHISLLPRRITWCIRTILIAKSAELCCPIFSTAELEKFSPTQETSRLLSQKDKDNISPTTKEDIATFMTLHGLHNPFTGNEKLEEFRTIFENSANLVALNFLGVVEGNLSPGDY